jgi:methionyl-tRNA formyltransferase
VTLPGPSAEQAGSVTQAAPVGRPGRTRTIFIGSGAFGAQALRELTRIPAVDIVGVVTAPARPAGRTGTLTPTLIAQEARLLGVGPILTPERLRDPAATVDILALGAELVVLADYGRIVPEALLDFPYGALNLHPSLLPRHRGAAPIQATILAGDRETGVSIIRMDRGVDTGPIVAAERVALTGHETAPELEADLADVAANLLARTVEPWIRGELVARPQDEDEATLTRPLQRTDGRLDPHRPAAELERAIRAYLPWPGTYLETSVMGRLIVRSGIAGPSASSDAPGRLVAEGDGLALTTANGRLLLGQVQLEGRRAMDASTLRRGAPSLVGTAVA